jgi:hypothetical protein
MQIPIFVLAAGCLIAGLAVRPLLAGLAPVLAIVMLQPAGTILEDLAPVQGSLVSLVTVGGIALALIVILAGFRRWLLRSREVRDAATWDCGYAAPAARMQYTSASFIQPLVDFFSPVLRSRKQIHEPRGLFPDAASANTHHEDVFLTVLCSRSYRGLGWLLSRLHWLQHGRLNLYVLYIALTLVALLAWQFGLREWLDQCVHWLSARQTTLF